MVRHFIKPFCLLPLQRDVEEAENLYTRGTEFTEDNHYAVDCIRPKCLELQRACAQYREVMRQRRDLLKQSEELQQRLDRVSTKTQTQGQYQNTNSEH